MSAASARSIGIAAGLGVLLGSGACTSEQRLAGVGPPPPRIMAPVGALQAQASGRIGELGPPVDLTEPGAWGSGTVEPTIIDTRLFAQQIADIGPGPEGIRELSEARPVEEGDLPPRPLDAPNDLPLGGLTGSRVGAVEAKFPGIGQTPWVPPDPTIAVGPTHIVETVNTAVAFFDKDGNKQFQTKLDASGDPGFFEDVGAGGFVFDPKCIYDQYSGRFVMTALEVYNGESWIVIAISDDSDPHGVWYKYRTDSRVEVEDAVYWVDYPGFGATPTGYFISGNLFLLEGNGGSFGGTLYRSFRKTEMLNGGTAFYTDLRDATAQSVQSVQHHGSTTAPMFVSVNSTALIKVQAIRNPFTNPLLVTTTVAVPDFAFPSRNVIDMNGAAYDPLDGRIINATARNGRLLAGHAVGKGTRNVSRWYEFQTGNWPNNGIPAFVQAGEVIGGASVHTWFPALIENSKGAFGLVTAMSSSSTLPSVQMTGRLPADPIGTMGALEEVIVAERSSADYRYGDYFDVALDPDGLTFWLVGQIYEREGWRTWISRFKVICPGDFNEDGVVDSRDVIAFLNAWAGEDESADWNGDGTYDTRDVIAYLNDYALGC